MDYRLKNAGPDMIFKQKLIEAWAKKIKKMNETELNTTIDELNIALKNAKKFTLKDTLEVSSLIFALKALNIAY